MNSASPGPAASDLPPGTRPFPAEGENTATLEAGRYVTSDPFPVSVSVTVPAGWKSEEPGAYVVFLSTADGVGNDGPATLALLLSPLEFSDPCTTDAPGTSVASVDDFVTVADNLAEDMLGEGLSRIIPGLAIVGEEAVHADATVLDRL